MPPGYKKLETGNHWFEELLLSLSNSDRSITWSRIFWSDLLKFCSHHWKQITFEQPLRSSDGLLSRVVPSSWPHRFTINKWVHRQSIRNSLSSLTQRGIIGQFNPTSPIQKPVSHWRVVKRSRLCVMYSLSVVSTVFLGSIKSALPLW